MATKPKTPAQVRDAQLAKLKKALDAGQITRAEFNSGVKEASAKYASVKAGPKAANAARTQITAAQKAAEARAIQQGAASRAIGTAGKLKATGKYGAMAAAAAAMPFMPERIRKAAAGVGQAMDKAVAGKYTPKYSSPSTGAGLDAQKAQAKNNLAAKAIKPADKGDSSRTPRGGVSPARRADSGDSTRTPKKVSQNGSVARLGASSGVYTVKSGDNLWNIAKSNKTTVSAILKANPTIAKRREAGKVDIFSGSKVRIPGKKK